MSFASMRCWTRYEPMKPAPPVMQMRVPVSAMESSPAKSSMSGLRRRRMRRLALRGRLAPQRKQFFLRHAVPDQVHDLLARAVEGGDDHQVVGDLVVLTDQAHRNAEEFVAVVVVEDRDGLEAE